jgi:hypothetical protein
MKKAKVVRLINAVMNWRRAFNNFYKCTPQYPLSRFSLEEQARQISRAEKNTHRLETSRKLAFKLAKQLYQELEVENESADRV